MSKLTVGVSTSSIEPSRNNGVVDGIGHYTQQLIQNLEAASVDVKGYAFPRFRAKSRFEHSISLGLPYQVMALGGILSKGGMFRTDPGVDIFHSTDFKVIPMRCPVVATIWDAIPMVHPEWFPGSFRQKMAPFFFRESARFADHIIAASAHAASDISRHFGIDEKKITVVPWGVDDVWFSHPGDFEIEKTLDKYGLNKGYYLSVGTLQPRKNYELLIDAYLQLPADVRKRRSLVIVGKYGWNCEALVNKLKSIEAQGEVIWLPHVDSDFEMRCLYRAAGVFAFPSLYEGFGVPVVEAFASQVPVVCSNTTSLPEVSAGAALEVDPTSVTEFCDALRLLDEDEGERSCRILLGEKRARELTWENTLHATQQVYDHILSGS